MQPLRLAVLLSGSGRTLDNLLERITSGHLAATIELVVSSREDVRGVRIAEAAGIPVSVVSPHEGLPWRISATRSSTRARGVLPIWW